MVNCPVCSSSNRPTARFCANCRAPLLLQGKYRITRLLGRGGFGAVYYAEQLNLGSTPCAIKELLADPTAPPEHEKHAADQFRFEASVLANLNHPALPKVTDFFNEGNRYYIIMDYVPGETLEERIVRERAPLPEREVLTWAEELCDALTYLHTQQPNPVIHRDLKPSNVKITPEGKVKLFDFGIAKLLVLGVATGTAARAGSPPYTPMEQYGTGTDARSDIYALGVTLYRLLTDRLPPEAPDRLYKPVVAPRHWNPALSPMTQAVILQAMAERPTERYASAAELKAALVMARTQPPPAPQPQPQPQPPPPVYAPHALPPVAGPAVAPLPVHALRVPSVPPKPQSWWSAWGWAVALLVSVIVLMVVGIYLGLRARESPPSTENVGALATSAARSTTTAQAQATASEQAQQATTTARDLARAETGTAQAQETGTARATRATATARARATATAQARLTQLAQTEIAFAATPTATPTSSPTVARKRLDPVSAYSSNYRLMGSRAVQSINVNEPATNNLAPLFEIPNGSISSAAWSPDGDRVLISFGWYEWDQSMGRALRTMNNDGSNWKDILLVLAQSPGYGGVNDRFYSYRAAIWSPDGKKIAVIHQEGGNQCTFLLDPDGTGLTKIDHCDYHDHPRFWSVDGKWIINWADDVHALYALAVDGSQRVPLSRLGNIKVYDERYAPWRVADAPTCAIPQDAPYGAEQYGIYWYCQ